VAGIANIFGESLKCNKCQDRYHEFCCGGEGRKRRVGKPCAIAWQNFLLQSKNGMTLQLQHNTSMFMVKLAPRLFHSFKIFVIVIMSKKPCPRVRGELVY
jgi:hypothetical protein